MTKIQFTDAEHRVPAGQARALDRVLREIFPGASWRDVRKLVESGKVRVDGRVATDPAVSVTPGAPLAITMAAPRPRAARLANDAIVFADAQVVVAQKPAGISTIPYEDAERGTLDQLVREALERREHKKRGALGIVHRIDKETSGLVVFTRTLQAKRDLEQQFRRHSVHRLYLAIVHGRIDDTTLTSRLVADRGDGLRGSTDNPRLGRVSTTHVRVREPLRDATLVDCTLETGRTHQIRIHLSEAGHPLLGERVYVRGYAGPGIEAPRLMLHAAELGFVHPSNGETLRFTQPMPDDMQQAIERLRTRPVRDKR